MTMRMACSRTAAEYFRVSRGGKQRMKKTERKGHHIFFLYIGISNQYAINKKLIFFYKKR